MADKRSASVAERRWLKVLGTLNELQARVFVAQGAGELGRGGVSRLARLTGMSRSTILKGMQELSGSGALSLPPEGRLRRAGGGRKPSAEVDPGLLNLIGDAFHPAWNYTLAPTPS
jgi:hypothetical protein